ncbi:alpha/beta hydrolase [Phyllobacteriaceae bacterium JZ32]
MKLIGAGIAAFGRCHFGNLTFVKAQDMSNGANNLYERSGDAGESHLQKPIPDECRGDLLIPKDLDRNARHPAIVVGHPMGAVKEQSATLYATKMAEQGFVAMAIELPFWGEGENR